MRWTRRAVLASLASGLALGASGCGLPNLFAWAVAPRHPKKKIVAEYPLEADSLVIVPYAGTDILFNDPTVSLELSRDILGMLVMALGPKIKKIVHPVQVIRWQESNVDWYNMSLVDIAKTFNADTLLYVELERYTMVEERSGNLLRGHIRAHIQLVKTAAERNPVYETNVETLCPEDRPVGTLDISERQLRVVTNRMFARDVVRKFQDYEIEDKGGKS